MFCSNCGTQLRDGVKFCSNCGNAIGSNSSQQVNRTISPLPYTHMVAAKCTNCGSALTVDSNLKKAVCPYCKFTYIVDQAINNYNISVTGNLQIANATINVAGVSVDNYIKRAEEYLNRGQYKEAIEYYEKVLDIEYDNELAKKRLQTIKEYTFYTEEGLWNRFLSPTVALKYGRLVITKRSMLSGMQSSEYLIDDIEYKSKGLLSDDEIYYRGKKLDFSGGETWKKLINDAKNGVYPILSLGSTLGENYAAEKSAIFENTKGNAVERTRLLQELGIKYGVFDAKFNIQSELNNGLEGYFLLVTLAFLEIANKYGSISAITEKNGWKTILENKDFILGVLNKYHLVEGNEDNLKKIEKLRNTKYERVWNSKPQGPAIDYLIAWLPEAISKAKRNME